jgi:hypothetical protein
VIYDDIVGLVIIFEKVIGLIENIGIKDNHIRQIQIIFIKDYTFRIYFSRTEACIISASQCETLVYANCVVIPFAAKLLSGVICPHINKREILLQKTYTTNFLNKTRVKNTGIVPQYYV